MVHIHSRPARYQKLRRPIFILLFFIFVSCSTRDANLSYHSDRGKKLVASKAMVSSAHPLASEAGLKMLEQGGNAIDAAVATAFALNVVEPNMSGIGGGGSMLIWNQKNQQADYVDFYTAKRAVSYKNVDYSQYKDDEHNLLSTGVPGTVDGLLQALERHGTMTRKQVMQPAIKYATEGFPVYLTLAQFIRENKEKLTRYDGAKQTFWPDDTPLKVGQILKQPALAQTLQKIADKGASAFYEGENAEDMVSILNQAGNPVSLKDFKNYEPQWSKKPLCGSYKGYQVLTAPMPQTGFYLIQSLNILENYDLRQIGLPTVSSKAFNIISSTMRLSTADRVEYVTDPNWKDVPVSGLTSKGYAAFRNEMIRDDSIPRKVSHGDPSNFVSDATQICNNVHREAAKETVNSVNPSGIRRASLVTNNIDRKTTEAEKSGETTHISILDPDGNAVSLSTTLSHVFGSGAWVNGFLLNNSGFDFSDLGDKVNWNAGHPYRIRASTISPTIILKDSEVQLVIGAPGGGRIPTAILQNILYILEYNLDPLDAVKMPRIFPDYSNPKVEIEKGFKSSVLVDIRKLGYDIQTLSDGYARLYLVAKKDGQLIGVSDPRHDGEPRGF